MRNIDKKRQRKIIHEALKIIVEQADAEEQKNLDVLQAEESVVSTIDTIINNLGKLADKTVQLVARGVDKYGDVADEISSLAKEFSDLKDRIVNDKVNKDDELMIGLDDEDEEETWMKEFSDDDKSEDLTPENFEDFGISLEDEDEEDEEEKDEDEEEDEDE